MDWLQEPLKFENFIDGKWQAPLDGSYVDNVNPSTAKVYGSLPDSSKADVDLAVAAAKAAFPSWSRTSVQRRSELLTRVADLLEARASEFARAESRDQGKPVSVATTVDLNRAVLNFRFFAGAIVHHYEQSTDGPQGHHNFTVRRPIGVVGLLAPWNLPLYLLTWKLAPALAVGNVCICKPSEFTSVTAAMLCTVLQDAGIPNGVVNMVFGTGPKTGAAICSHPEIPAISFTGGTVTGEHVMRAASPSIKKLYLELGGKNPVIVFPDANLDECVATTVRSSFSNQGEICLCGSRVLVHEDIYEQFLARFVEAVAKLKVGDPNDPTSNLGALVSEPHYSKVLSYVELAKKEGRIVFGGEKPKDLPEHLRNGYFLQPTVVTDLSGDCRVQTEEIFGPVVGITRFSSEQEALEIANSSNYGLAAVVWSQDVTRVHRFAPQLQAGTVWVNCWMVRDLRAPFGGWKMSGLGRAGGQDSIDFFTQRTNVCIKYE
jgi:acyl-CoA reductase-like NAD-dependent aldehyde dehydrogenase